MYGRTFSKIGPMLGKRGKVALFTVPVLAATGLVSKLTGDRDDVPGERETVKSRVGETIASALQSFKPLSSLDTHVASVKCYSKDNTRQMPVHEYLGHLNDDVMQAVITDSDRKDAKIIGVEYIITQKVFDKLPAEEQKLWVYKGGEVTSGTMVAPRMPGPMEHKLMQDLAPTYGKSFALWQVDKYPLPLGVPQLLSVPRSDSLSRDLLNQRDKALGIDSQRGADDRRDIRPPRESPGSNHGESITLKVA